MLSSIYWLKALILLKFSTTSTMASATLSASSRVLYRLKVKRTEPWALSCPPPIPRITWLAFRVRLKQADPVLTAKPLISRWRVMDSPSTSSKVMLTFWGNLFSGWPFKMVLGTSFKSRSIRWSRNF